MNEQHIIEAIKDATDIEAGSVEAAVDQLIDYHFDVAMGLQNDCNTYKAEIERLNAALETERGQRLTLDAANNINAERGNEFEAAYEESLKTINTLKTALRNIYLTASKATPTEYASALGKVEAAAFIVLDETLEPLA